ncbi:MAG: SMI1/KNR4 family protein [Chthonomonadaceae bacterium]|nr:SMI1/KNR4 family protein [Chthonomonadaceae bacterium]
MAQHSIREIADFLVQTKLLELDQLLGYTEAEINHLEGLVGSPLPLSFRQFLKIMGHGAGNLFEGEDFFFLSPHWYSTLRDNAVALLAENGNPFTLPENAFVFTSHQGWMFAYFLLDPDEDDPPVYSYGETDEGEVPVRDADTFTQYLKSRIDLEMEQHRDR